MSTHVLETTNHNTVDWNIFYYIETNPIFELACSDNLQSTISTGREEKSASKPKKRYQAFLKTVLAQTHHALKLDNEININYSSKRYNQCIV